MLTIETIKARLADLQMPYLNQSLVEAGFLENIIIEEGHVAIHVKCGIPSKYIQQDLLNLLQAFLPEVALELKMETDIIAHAVPAGLKGLTGVKNVIAVASGKGGVGKSTTCVNLALALAVEGARVGILDADIYGPNQPQMLGVSGHPEVSDDKKLKPMESYGVQSMSIGYLIEQTDTPMIWRGPMVSSALQQLLNDTEWQDLDYLFIDLPPGTGDIQLTMSQKIPVTGAVIVTTPQDIALLDARKAVKMFEKVKVPVLGVVENMSLHTCSQCGHQERIFGEGGAAKMAVDYQIELLGALPLAMNIREDADAGKPTVVAEPEGDIANQYRDIALRVAAKLSLQGKDLMRKFPKIVVE